MKNAQWWGPLFFFILMAPFTPFLDLAISNYFYHPETHRFSHNVFFVFLYEYGPLPAILTASVASLIFLFSYCCLSLKKLREASLILCLTMVLGSGVVVHSLLKENWGRPRPKQIVQFGGTEAFLPFYKPNFHQLGVIGKSFSCGHCSTGFYFFALAILGIRLKKRSLFYWGMSLSLFLGVALSLTRIAQGGHFFSDTLVSGLIMWYTALVLNWLIHSPDVLVSRRGPLF